MKKLTVEDIAIPQLMADAFDKAWEALGTSPRDALAFALLALAVQPIVPSLEDADELRDTSGNASEVVQKCISEWQRRMFLKPQPEFAPELKRLVDEFAENRCVFGGVHAERQAETEKFVREILAIREDGGGR